MIPEYIKLYCQGVQGFFIDLRTGELYRLNSTGLRLCKALQEGIPENQLAGILAAEFDVDYEQATKDINVFLSQFRQLDDLQ